MNNELTRLINRNYQKLQEISRTVCEASTNESHAEDILHDVLFYMDTKYSEHYLKDFRDIDFIRFITAAIKRQISSKKSITYSKYRKHLGNSDGFVIAKNENKIADETEYEQNEDFLRYLEDCLEFVWHNELSLFEQVVLHRYLFYFQSQQQLGEAAKLSQMSISRSLKEAAKKIDSQVQETYPDFSCKGRLKSLKPILKLVLQ